MATNQGLNVQLSADASQFVASLQAAIAAAQAAASGLADPASSMNSLSSAANAATAASNALATSLNNTASAASRSSTAVNTLSPTSSAAAAGINNLANAVNAGQASFNRIGQSSTTASGAFVRLNRDVLGASAVMRGFANDARNGRVSFVELSGAVTNAGRAIPTTNTALTRLGASTGRAGQIATNFGRILSDLPFGFIAIQNNIDPLIQSLGLSAGIGLAFTLAGAAATTLAQKYGGLGNAITALNPFTTNQTKAQLALNAAMVSGANESQAEITRLQILFAAAKDLNVPLSERKKITDELIKQYPQTLKGATAEKIAIGELDDEYQKLVKSLAAKAIVQAGTDAIGKQGKALLELRLEASALAKQLKDVQENSGKSSLSNPFGADPIKVGRQIDAIQNSINGNKKKESDINQQIAEVQKIILQQAEQYGATSLGITENADKKVKNVKTIADVLKTLTAELNAVDYQAKLTGASFDKISSDKIGALQKAFDELVKLGLKPASPEIQSISRQINLLAAATIGSVPIQTKNLLALGKAFQSIKAPNLSVSALQDLLKVMDRSSQLGIKAPVVPAPEIRNGAGLENVDKFQKQFNDRLDKLKNDTQSKVDKSTIVWGNITSGIGPAVVDLGSQLRGFASSAAVGLGEVIGSIASGGASLGQSLGRLVGVMGQFIVDFGKSLIEAATLRIIAEKTLFANPYVALAAGVAAVAIGSVLKNSVPSFATGGGIIGGPQLSMIGDNPGREEYVIPSEVLDKMGGGARTVRIIGKVKGQDIYYVNERAKRVKARV